MWNFKREKGFTDKFQFKKWKYNHAKIRGVLHEVWFQKFVRLLKEGEKPDEPDIYRGEILSGLKARGIVIPETSPTLSKHLRVFVDDGELIEFSKNDCYPHYKLNVSGALGNIKKIAMSLGLKRPYAYKHLLHPKPVENILEIQIYKPHQYPEIDSPDSALKKYVADLFKKEGRWIIPRTYLMGDKDPTKMSNRVLYKAFGGKGKVRKRETIHQSLNYIVYTVNKEELFHYLKTPKGKRWLIDTLK